MNWKEIEEKYKTAFSIFKIWAIKNAGIDMSLHGEVYFDDTTFEVGNYRYNRTFQDRELYDFFDSINLYILIDQYDAGEFIYEIHSNENYEASPGGTAGFGKKGHHTIEMANSEDLSFDERREAEKEAFLAAFNITEENHELVLTLQINMIYDKT